MTLDYTGLRCPQPSLKLSIKARSISPGTMVEVLAESIQEVAASL